MNTRKLQDGFAPLHVNWVAAEQLDANEVKNFKNTPLYIVKRRRHQQDAVVESLGYG